MNRGKNRRLPLFLAGALAGGLAFAAPSAPASAKTPTPAHAKPKAKKPKPAAKGGHHTAGGASKSAAKAHGSPPPAPAPVARATAKSQPESLEIRLPIQRVTLDNGLRVVMSVDKTTSSVALAVAYDVGSRDEAKGHCGSARLLERMMFQGSANVLPGDHARLIASHGGRATSLTGTEMTMFSDTLPETELALGLWLEADRMRALDMKPEAFEAERRAAQQEARAALSSARSSSGAHMSELIFQGSWAYEHGPQGSVEDLGAATLDELLTLKNARYGPNNAALVIAGDFEPDAAMALVHKHFDAIPRVTVPARAESDEAAVPEQTAQRTAVVHSDDVTSPEVRYGWAIPETKSPDRAAVELAAIVLADGESSRLYQALVRDRAAADSVSSTLTPPSRGPGSLRIAAKLADTAKIGDVEKIIELELKKLGSTPPTDAELQRARRRARSKFLVEGLSTIASRAERLATYEVVLGSALPIQEELPKIAAVSGEDVRKAAARFLGPTRRTLVETFPTGVQEPAKPAGEPRATSGASPSESPAHAHPAHEASKAASTSGGAESKKAAKAHAAKTKAAADAKKKKKTASSAKPKKPKKP